MHELRHEFTALDSRSCIGAGPTGSSWVVIRPVVSGVIAVLILGDL